jgi:hypothetical protein
VRATNWAVLLAVLHYAHWAGLVTYWSLVFPPLADDIRAGRTVTFNSFIDGPVGLYLGLLALAALFFVLQTIYLRGVTNIVAEAAAASGTRPPPHSGMAAAFAGLFLLAAVPLVGGLLWIGGVALAIVWAVLMQLSLNAYWAGQPRTPQTLPSFGRPALA